MSKFIDRLDRIMEGTPAAMGFGVRREQKSPGMALLAIVSGSDAKALEQVAELNPDGVLVSGVDDPAKLKEACQALGESIPWGKPVTSLTEDEANSYEKEGCDLLAFSLQGTSLAAVGSEDVARILRVDITMDPEQLRVIDALPVDVLLIGGPGETTAWSLEDLMAVAGVSRRVNKYVIVETSQLPGAKELEALRSAGINGLAVDVAKVPAEKLTELRKAQEDMPRQRPNKRDRTLAILPQSAFPYGSSSEPQEPEPDEEDE
ncbi:MAG: hypothetical protein BZY75_02905 [SAR202 cluster bacterium Io17-Chloro-G7]|nr:MAG: hypothetical protein BZY75_02905 [SAR202 cluster bacterium Io17-Chloro-G7]